MPRGFSRDFVPLGMVTVTCPKGGCTPAPSRCVDKPFYRTICEHPNTIKHVCWKADWMPMSVTGRGYFTMGELCPKSCGLWGGGVKPQRPPPPPPPLGTGMVKDKCVKIHSLI